MKETCPLSDKISFVLVKGTPKKEEQEMTENDTKKDGGKDADV